MLFHRSETFLHVTSVTDLCSGAASKQDSVTNMMELAWVATHLDDDAISVGTESAWSEFSGENGDLFCTKHYLESFAKE